MKALERISKPLFTATEPEGTGLPSPVLGSVVGMLNSPSGLPPRAPASSIPFLAHSFWLGLATKGVLRCAQFVFLFTVSVAGKVSAGTHVPGPAKLFGALAYSRSTGQIGKAVAEETAKMAEESALRGCGAADCEIKSEVVRGCIGIAKGWESPGPSHVQPSPNHYWYGFGSVRFQRPVDVMTEEELKQAFDKTRNRAVITAIGACENASHSQCQAVDSFCTWDAGTAPASEEIRVWIHRFGGESSPRMLNVLQLLRVAAQNYLLRIGLPYRQALCLSSRSFSFVENAAITCNLTMGHLDILMVDANKYGWGEPLSPS